MFKFLELLNLKYKITLYKVAKIVEDALKDRFKITIKKRIYGSQQRTIFPTFSTFSL